MTTARQAQGTVPRGRVINIAHVLCTCSTSDYGALSTYCKACMMTDGDTMKAGSAAQDGPCASYSSPAAGSAGLEMFIYDYNMEKISFGVYSTCAAFAIQTVDRCGLILVILVVSCLPLPVIRDSR